jgi:hypothetical protein
MEALYLVCGARRPQLMRDSLGCAEGSPLLHVSLLLARSTILAAAVVACRPSTPLQGTYILQTIDGASPPATMFTYAGDNHSQLITATITFDNADGAIYKWQYRVLQPQGQVDTLQQGTDTFSVTHTGSEVLLSRYRRAGPDSPDSVLQVDTIQFLGETLVLRDKSVVEGGVRRHVLRFARS